ncbi:hypothetical protein SAMN06265349_101702 [Flavobacterium resistens]|uniref:Uncharacterized protein n=2 Tax=Flavobacterium resistens TaxID=443612 RepID=A0A521B6R2_9FLAO|nr:hypothetical protein [Flavobacterium resistens]MRX70294.1 hypothetical protein [Flavobacterium resistens]SMO42350.1 hypothetical protein SAMN06265349_101702 [Flavobacterium resistens]
MTEHEVQNRLNFLDVINSFLFEDIPVEIKGVTLYRKRNILTDGEKICISQERASLRDFISHKNGEINEKQVRNYKVSQKIEDKINACVIIIKQTNWHKTYKRNY